MKQPDPRLKNFTTKRELMIKLMKIFGIENRDIKVKFYGPNREANKSD